jgi:hypothetical protein
MISRVALTTSNRMLSMSRSRAMQLRHTVQRKNMSSTAAPEGGILGLPDTAKMKHINHKISLGMAGLMPLYAMLPGDNWFHKAFGFFLSINVTTHAWLGMHQIASDYVPKVSKKLLGPAKIFNVGLAAVMFLGLSRINFSSPGGIKGMIVGLWRPEASKEASKKN